MSRAASLQHGQVEVSWIDIIQQVNSGTNLAGLTGKSILERRIREICPEHAAKLTDFKHVQSLVSRVDPAVYTAVEDEIVARDMTTHPPADLVAGP